MRLAKIFDIFSKEILDTLRDRRTLLILFAVPVLLYPGLLIFVNELASSQQAKLEQKTVRLALIGVPEDASLRQKIAKDPQMQLTSSANPFADLSAGKIDFVLEMPSHADQILAENKTATLNIHYDASNDEAITNIDHVWDLVNAYNSDLLQERLRKKSLPEEYVKPLDSKEINVASKQRMGGFLIGKFLPMIMVLMVLMGAMYPAIDMTAGEKERGTLETILASPASSTEIVLGKFLTVALIALLTGLLNLGAMMGTFTFGIFHQVAEAIQIKIPFSTFLIMLICLVPLAIFFSGLMMAVASFARSFKEAQNLLTPVYLLATMPALVSFIPGIQLDGFWITLPVANVVLLFKELMLGVFLADHIVLVFLSVAFMACVSIFLAIRLFGREEVLFGEASSFGLTFRRSNIQAKPLPEQSEVLFFCLICLALIIYVAVPLQMWNITFGLIVTEIVFFFLFPIGFALYLKLDLRRTFSLRAPDVKSVLLTVLLFAGLQLTLGMIQYLQNQIFPMPPQLNDYLEKIIRGTKGESFVLLFSIIALLPAVCEEVTFRGLVLPGMLNGAKPWTAILATSALFAIFHLSLHRFLPVFLLGGAITLVVWKSGSIFTGMLLHLLNNGFATFLINYPQYDLLHLNSPTPSAGLFFIGVVLVAVSLWLFAGNTHHKDEKAT